MKNLFHTLSAIALLAAVPVAHSQSFETSSNGFEVPVGMSSLSDIDNPVSSIRDANFNRLDINTPNMGFAVTTVGNLVNVVTSGSNNTVVVNADQVNSGNQVTTIAGKLPTNQTAVPAN